jgi:hypothetical protein
VRCGRGGRPQTQGWARALRCSVATRVASSIAWAWAKDWPANASRRQRRHPPSCQLSQQAPVGRGTGWPRGCCSPHAWIGPLVSFTTGDALAVTASGSWSPGPGFGVWGRDGANFAWADTFFDLADIGVCAFCAQTRVGNYATLIGYIGSNPPAPGSYTSTSVLPEAQKVFLVGSNYHGSAATTGTLYLAFNDDAYSGNIFDNSGSVTASVSGGLAFGLPSAAASTINVFDSQGRIVSLTNDYTGNFAYPLDGASTGKIVVQLLDSQGLPHPEYAGKVMEVFANSIGSGTVDLTDPNAPPLTGNTCGVGTPQPDGSSGPPLMTDSIGTVTWNIANACPGEISKVAITVEDKTDNVTLATTVTVLFKRIHPIFLVHGINDSANFWACDKIG